MRIKLKSKMMLFAAAIAVLPLVTSGQSIIRIAQDELKSAANEQIAAAAQQITDQFNVFHEQSLFTPLDLIRNAINNPKLGPSEKVFLLQQGISDLPNVVALQIDVQGAPQPLLVVQEDYRQKLAQHYDVPLDVVKVAPDEANIQQEWDERRFKSFKTVEKTGDRLALIGMKIPDGISGRAAVLHARIKLDRLKEIIETSPFSKIGEIHVANEKREIVFGSSGSKYDHAPVMNAAVEMLSSKTGTISTGPFELADGDVSLAAISVPRAYPWAILVEKSEADAYQPINDMIAGLFRWLSIGMAAALLGAYIFSRQLSKPILKIGDAAQKIAGGEFEVSVDGVTQDDEIGDLAKRFNNMIVQLQERFELQKFVSRGTMDAIQKSDGQEVSLGGERRRVAILFADIRGYTAFSEKREPEEVVAVLNSYFQQISNIVSTNHGDIDKFVGDEVMAVFTGERDVKHAVECAIEIMNSMEKMTADSGADLRIGIGINVGEVVAGAMGSRERKDFTVLGDAVNLAARLCGQAAAGETLVTQACMDVLPEKLAERGKKLPPIKVKGKVDDIQTYAFTGENV